MRYFQFLKTITFFVIFSMLTACGSDDNNQRNPFLSERPFSLDLNLNLPENDAIRFVGGTVYNSQGGIRGVFVHRSTQTTMLAWEASCPNQFPNSCSTMRIDGATVVCSCEGYTYSLAIGVPFSESEDGEVLFPLLQYSAQFSGNTVSVSN